MVNSSPTNDFFCLFSEFLYDKRNVFPYNCDRKEEFIKKGMGQWTEWLH